MNKILSTIISTLLILLFLASSGIYYLQKQHFVTSLSFQNQIISIQRDQYGIPQIKAQTFNGLMFAWAYVLSQDRIFQLAFKRQTLQGRLSEIFGQRTIKVDQFFRALNLNDWAIKSAQMAKKNESVYKQLQSFVDGINTYVDQLRIMSLDFQFTQLKWKKWQVSDIFLLHYGLIWGQSSLTSTDKYVRTVLLKKFSKQEVINFIPFKQEDYIISDPIIKDHQISSEYLKIAQKIRKDHYNSQEIKRILEVGVPNFINYGGASNSWVISGNYTKSGSPIIANDPHLIASLPTQWYQLRVQYEKNGKKYRQVGYSIAGTPFIIGKSNNFAWGVTTNVCDGIDLYQEKIQNEKYLYDGNWINLKKREETIQIKGQKPLKKTIYETHRGPVVNHLISFKDAIQMTNYNVSYAWIYFQANYQSLHSLMHSREIQSVKDFEGLVQNVDMTSPSNIVFISKDKHIGFFTSGIYPIRRNPQQGMFMRDGTTSKSQWIGILKGRGKISLVDPEKGYIVTANNHVAGKQYLNGIFQTSTPTARSVRIEQMINQYIQKGIKLTVEDMKTMQHDTIDVYCRKIIDHLIGVLPQENLLKNFDCNFTKSSYQASVYEVIIYETFKSAPVQIYKSLQARTLHYAYDLILNEQKGSVFMAKVYQNAIEFLQNRFETKQNIKWRWGQLHKELVMHRPFSNSQFLKRFYERKVQGQGNSNTVNVNQGTYGTDTFNSVIKANIRAVMSFQEDSFWTTDGGSSQNFLSKHYDDQMKIHDGNQYILMDPSPHKTAQIQSKSTNKNKYQNESL